MDSLPRFLEKYQVLGFSTRVHGCIAICRRAICRITICRLNLTIRQIAQKKTNCRRRRPIGWRVARCLLRSQTFACPLLFYCLSFHVVRTTFRQIVIWQILIQHFFYCLRKRKFAKKCHLAFCFGRNVFGKPHGSCVHLCPHW